MVATRGQGGTEQLMGVSYQGKCFKPFIRRRRILTLHDSEPAGCTECVIRAAHKAIRLVSRAHEVLVFVRVALDALLRWVCARATLQCLNLVPLQ
jgi:hypothetical protein